MWQSLWNPTVRKLSWQFSVLENTHVSDESAALLYKTHCNQVIGLILVTIICHIYVFGLRTILWKKLTFIPRKKLYYVHKMFVTSANQKVSLCWTCLENLLHSSPHKLSNFGYLQFRKIILKLILNFWHILGYIEKGKAIIRLTTKFKFLSLILLYSCKLIVVYKL